MIDRKYIISLNPKKEFYDFWIDNCRGVGKIKQLDILYKENFSFGSWLLTKLLDKEGRKDYALYAATAVLPIFEVQYTLDTRANDAIQASTNNTITQNILNDVFSAYVMAAGDSFNANYTYSVYSAYNASYGAFARLTNKEKSNFTDIANLTAISAVNADVTKKQEIFNYGLGLL